MWGQKYPYFRASGILLLIFYLLLTIDFHLCLLISFVYPLTLKQKGESWSRTTSDNDHHWRRQPRGLRRHRRQPRGLRRQRRGLRRHRRERGLGRQPHDSGESSNTDLVNRTQLSSTYFRYFRLGFVLEFDIVDFQKLKYLLVDFHLVFCEFEMLLFE